MYHVLINLDGQDGKTCYLRKLNLPFIPTVETLLELMIGDKPECLVVTTVNYHEQGDTIEIDCKMSDDILLDPDNAYKGPLVQRFESDTRWSITNNS
jgi:hypothetical protein